MATHLGFLPGKSRGQRSLGGYSPQGPKESDMTEATFLPEELAWATQGAHTPAFPLRALQRHPQASPGSPIGIFILLLSESRSVLSNSWRPHGLCSPWNSPGRNTGVGSLSLLQGIFPAQGLNPGLLHCLWILYQLSHQGSPRILEWVAFSRGSSQSRSRTRVSCIVGGFFTN